MTDALSPGTRSPFGLNRRVNDVGNLHGSGSNLAQILDCVG
jgi:hypothetical protein